MPGHLAHAKKLIVAPHVDDEVLGCGGILDKNSVVYYCGIDESRVTPDPEHRVPLEERMRELQATTDFLGFSYEINRRSKVNFFVEQEIKDDLERIVNEIRPDMIFLPHPGYNQDHRTVFNAAQVALRPHDKIFFAKTVLVYEGIHDALWSHVPFRPNYFVPIDIERKLHAYGLQPSQVRGMRSPEMLRALARLRGAACNAEYAEAFEVLRLVV
ncbi:MAG: PIG-L family deacetylase [bacterium]|nr:PIG-L family deacetylase [bacterium]